MVTATQSVLIRDQRELRARRFASQISHMLHDYIPDFCRDRVYNELFRMSIENNIEIICLPPEMDGLRYIQAEMERLMTKPTIFKDQA